jgi:hypothetical protein
LRDVFGTGTVMVERPQSAMQALVQVRVVENYEREWPSTICTVAANKATYHIWFQAHVKP